ncbi:MAG: hypothetical protein E3J21_08610 [Anaerolineales bacterium]|nr:MAG: hypothetical protein E3J21_08610 [Anaerolineales bacterium]
MAWGLFEALGSTVEAVRGFISGIFGQAAREKIEFPTISEALEAGGLEIEIPKLHEDFQLAEQQSDIARRISKLSSDFLIPGVMHLETDRLLPTRYAYEVEINQYDAEGNLTTKPFYVGSDKRRTPDEILDVAGSNVDQSPDAGTVAYEVGGISAAWFSTVRQ